MSDDSDDYSSEDYSSDDESFYLEPDVKLEEEPEEDFSHLISVPEPEEIKRIKLLSSEITVRVKDNLKSLRLSLNKMIYKCKHCSQWFWTLEKFRAHNRRFHAVKRCTCIFCKENFISRVMLMRHKDFVHQENLKKKHGCALCERSFFLKENHERHLKVHMEPILSDDKYQCIVCSRKFENRNNFTDHLATHVKKEDIDAIKQTKAKRFRPRLIQTKRFERSAVTNKFPCNLCEKQYNHLKDIRRHFDCFHEIEVEKKYHCDRCPRSFGLKESVRHHLTRTQCKTLKKIVRQNFKDNFPRSPDTDRIHCDLCEKTFKTHHGLALHRDNIHQAGEIKNFLCLECPRWFTLRFNFRMHLKTHQGVAQSKKSLYRHYDNQHSLDKVNRFQCDQCPRSFNYKENMSRHFTKLQCGKTEKIRQVTVRTNKVVRKFRELKDERKTAYRCRQCKRSFVCKSSLLCHKDMEHQNDEVRKYPCLSCERSFEIMQNFQRHQKAKHDPNNSSNNNKNLKDSISSVKSKKIKEDLSCNVCGNEYFTRHGRDQHEDYEHGSSESSKRYPCTVDLCSQSFAFKSNFKRHLTKCLTGKVEKDNNSPRPMTRRNLTL